MVDLAISHWSHVRLRIFGQICRPFCHSTCRCKYRRTTVGDFGGLVETGVVHFETFFCQGHLPHRHSGCPIRYLFLHSSESSLQIVSSIVFLCKNEFLHLSIWFNPAVYWFNYWRYLFSIIWWTSNEILNDIKTMLCPIKVNSNTIELTLHTSCYCVLDLLCVP